MGRTSRTSSKVVHQPRKGIPKLTKGIDPKDIASLRSRFGSNKLPEPVSKNFLEFVWEALKDKTLIVLMFAAALEISIGIYKSWFAPQKDQLALIDGGAILVASIYV